jgi:ankyrin repeat protein
LVEQSVQHVPSNTKELTFPLPPLIHAIRREDIQDIEYLISIGANVDARDSFDDTALVNAIQIENEQTRLAIVEILLESRADPKLLDDSHRGPLFVAAVRMDYRVLELLLKYGADPNSEFDPDEHESLYDWAECDYRFEVFDLHLPKDPTEVDKASEENWLEYLDRLALSYGKRRPDYLQLLRRYGAKTFKELQ